MAAPPQPALTVRSGLPPSRHAMNPPSRREFLATGLALGATLPVLRAAPAPRRLFTLDLTPGAIGVGGDLRAQIALAHRHGFESVQPDGGFLAGQDADGIRATAEALTRNGLKWGSGNMPVEFRQGDEVFERDLAGLPRIAAALKAAGATRIGTWIMPGHNELEFKANLERHANRLRKVSTILRDHGLRFGLEYVGTPSLAARFKFPFVRRLAEARQLVEAIGVPGTGLILDSWHWFTAGDTPAALRTVRNAEIVAVDLNDAPAGVALADQQDNRRELPAATGVIPVRDFLSALIDAGYDGPVRAEPFNKPLNDLDDDGACARTIAALRKAVALVSPA